MATRNWIWRWLPILFVFAATSTLGATYPRIYEVRIGCSSDIAEDDCPTTPANTFFPSALFIAVGDSVMFFNNDFDQSGAGRQAHNVAAYDGSFRCAEGCDGEGGNGSPSAAPWYFTRRFDAPGIVSYHDEVTGATGVINVASLPASPQAVAVEYYYAAWNTYFVTASPEEIAALDAGSLGGAWQRTGETFDVWTDPADGLVPMCRFFSTAFGSKSAHLFTPDPAECVSLQAGTEWQYEGVAFHVELPVADGGCTGASIPLYRGYNKGMGGAPNYRFTTDFRVIGQMQTAGWSFDNNGDILTPFACVPRP